MQMVGLVRKRGTKFELTSPPVLRLAQEIKAHPSILEARVADCLIKHPGSTAREIAFETGELVGGVVHCLKRMNHLGVVYHVGRTQRAYYAQNPLRRRYFLHTYFVFMLGAGGQKR
jgi:hypothetical protein